MKKYFFSQDESSHWYQIPAERRSRWNQLNSLTGTVGWTDEDYYDAINEEFGEYRTDGGISDIEFFLPDEPITH